MADIKKRKKKQPEKKLNYQLYLNIMGICIFYVTHKSAAYKNDQPLKGTVSRELFSNWDQGLLD